MKYNKAELMSRTKHYERNNEISIGVSEGCDELKKQRMTRFTDPRNLQGYTNDVVN